jgi:hypothetical protein
VGGFPVERRKERLILREGKVQWTRLWKTGGRGAIPHCFAKSAEEYENGQVTGDFEEEVCAKSAEELENKRVKVISRAASEVGVSLKGVPPPLALS